MALDVELVLLQPRDVELLSGCAALELARDVLLVVADDLGDDASRADAFCALGDEEFALLLDRLVDVVALAGAVWDVVVCDVVDVVLSQEIHVNHPRTVLDHLVDPFAVPN